MDKNKYTLVSNNHRDKNTSDLYVVGIGASAGGLEALEGFFVNCEPHRKFAYVVIQHLSPDYKSLMGQLLSKHTSLKISQLLNQL